MSRKLISGAVLSLLVSGFGLLSAAPTGEAKTTFRLTAEFDGISQIAPDAKVVSLVVREGETTEIPITLQFETEDGARVRFHGSNLFVPTKESINTDDLSHNEQIPAGLHLSVRIQALPDGRALVDTTFSSTAAEDHDVEAKTLLATTTAVRQVRPLGSKDSVEVRLPKEGGGPTVVLKVTPDKA